MKIKTIANYSSPAELITENSDIKLTQEQFNILDGACDYDNYLFTLINDNIVVSSIDGSVYATETIQEFIKQSIDYTTGETI